MFKNINLSQIVPIVVISLFIGVVFVYANWSSPPASPPTCPFTNSACNAPINASEATQYKSGSLGIGGVFQVFSDAVFNRNVKVATLNIGTGSDSTPIRVITECRRCKKRTSTKYNGNLGGVAGANQKCAAEFGSGWKFAGNGNINCTANSQYTYNWIDGASNYAEIRRSYEIMKTTCAAGDDAWFNNNDKNCNGWTYGDNTSPPEGYAMYPNSCADWWRWGCGAKNTLLCEYTCPGF